MTTVTTDLNRLETILRELKEAVVVCDQNARILLYNSAATSLFAEFEAMGLGQSLYTICARAPIEHILRMLKHRSAEIDNVDTDARFVCSTVDGRMLLQCHVNQICSDTDQGCAFIFTIEDMTRRIAESGRQGYLLDKMIKDLRAPITNLNIAVENLKLFPEMSPEVRSDFEEIIARESAEVTRRFEAVAEESMKVTKAQWPLFDVYSADLIGCIVRRFREGDDIRVIMTGVPLWLHADSYSLVLVLERLVRFVCDLCSVVEVDIEALLGDRRVYIDIVWKGEPISQSAVDGMMEEKLPDPESEMTVVDVLERHNSLIWSQKHRREGYSLLRLPVPDSPRQWDEPHESLPERPEFYDFSIAGQVSELGAMADLLLSKMNYAVFDIETTGLKPSEGDEIVSITAVRIVNGRILSGERFERLIKPRRPIPENLLTLLEITDEMLRDESPIEVVMPQFKSFVGDAVLVGHNCGFDMQFFQSVENESGGTITNPCLDTLLLALIADTGRVKYTLDSIGKWLEVDNLRGGTLMDNCFFTAQIFLRLLEMLEKLDIRTIGQVMAATERIVEGKREP